MTYTIAVRTVKNSWRCTEELSETCSISLQKYISEFSAYSWFYYKKFIVMHGQMNVKLDCVVNMPMVGLTVLEFL